MSNTGRAGLVLPVPKVKRSANKPSAAAQAFAAYVTQHGARLRKLPYFASETEVFERLAGLVPGKPLADLLGEVLQGMSPIYRHIALDYAAATMKTKSRDKRRDLRVTRTQVFLGDLHVTGMLRNDACLVVLGDLRVDGSYLALPEYPTLYVGGTLRARDFYASESETICGTELAIKNRLVLVYNHTVTIAPKVTTKVLIADDAGIDGKVTVATKDKGSRYDAYRKHFGLTFDTKADDFDSSEIHDDVIATLSGKKPKVRTPKPAPKPAEKASKPTKLPRMTSTAAYEQWLAACRDGDLALVESFLAKKFAVDRHIGLRGGDPWTGLMTAAWKGHLPIVQTLLAAGADPNINTQATALIFAAGNGDQAIVEALLAAGADATLVTRRSQKGALDYASERDHLKVLSLLEAGGAKRVPGG